MGTVTWLHISDLHFRTDKSFAGEHSWNQDIVLKALVSDIHERIGRDGLRPDFILVSGDIAYKGSAQEYNLAAGFFDRLLETTGLSKERLFVVPGNHDVDRQRVSLAAKALARSLDSRDAFREAVATPTDRRVLFARLDPFAEFTRCYFAGQLSFDDDHYFYVRRLVLPAGPLAILGLNSAWLATGERDDQNHLALGDQQIRKALECTQDGDTCISLMHHPFEWLHDKDRQDCEALLMRRCAFVLHGHLHRTGLALNSTPDGAAIVVAAGASYDGRESRNAYNLVWLDLENGQGTVFLRMYSDRSGGFWTKDVLTYKNAPDGRVDFRL